MASATISFEPSQSSSWPRSSITCRAAIAMLRLMKPVQSSRAWVRRRGAGRKRTMPMKVTTPIGRLM